ncbi:Multivesicular body subunit 12B [Nymphon striatum]|nr:Multivesicular body subunit 12B [Nymphon striatum]
MPPKFKKGVSDIDFQQADNVEKESLLHGDDDDDEDFFLRGPTSSNRTVNVKHDSKLNSVRVQINEITDVMKNNIGKIMERGDKLDDLQEKSDNLTSNADEFRVASRKVQKRMWWRDFKVKDMTETKADWDDDVSHYSESKWNDLFGAMDDEEEFEVEADTCCCFDCDIVTHYQKDLNDPHDFENVLEVLSNKKMEICYILKMMEDLYNALPDENPITSLCIVEEPSNCPAGHNLVSKTHDQDTDADLWKDGFFRSKVTRYLCYSKTVLQEDHVLESIIILNDKDQTPRDYSAIGMTRDSDQPAMKKKLFCLKLAHHSALEEAITDVIVLSKYNRRPPTGFMISGEINGLSICYKLGKLKSSKENKVLQSNLPYQLAPGATPSQGFPTWSPGYRPNTGNANSQHKTGSSVNYSTAIDGVPFEINAKYNLKNLSNFIVPQINVKTAEQLEHEYGYDFRVEYQTQQRIPSEMQ